MDTVYVIIEENGYDGFNPPHGDVFYTNKEMAEKEAKRLNINAGCRRDYFFVEELAPAKT